MKQFEIKSLVREYTYDELNETDRQLVDKAKESTRNAYAPFSHYHVGAALLLENGQIVCGSNQENAAYPTGLCAERTAVFYASSSNPGMPIRKIAVASWQPPKEGEPEEAGFQKHPTSPCGGCRQALIEYEHLSGDIEVILYGSEKIFVLPSVASLLPLGFTDF